MRHASNAEKVISMYPALPTRIRNGGWSYAYYNYGALVQRVQVYYVHMYLPWYVTCALVHDIMVKSTLRKRSQPACTRQNRQKTPTLVQRKLVRPWPDRPDRFRRPCQSIIFACHGSRHDLTFATRRTILQ